MTDTPRTAAGRPMIECLCGDLLLTVEDMFEHLRIQHALDDCPEDEAAAPPPESGWPFHTNEELEALTPGKPAEPLDMERLARAIANVSGDGRVLDVDREETRKVAAEYNRLAAAAPTLADLPRTRGDGTVAYEPSDEPAESLDVERLAYMFEHGIPRGAPPNPYTPEAKLWAMDYAKRFAAEYNRLAAARPEAER